MFNGHEEDPIFPCDKSKDNNDQSFISSGCPMVHPAAIIFDEYENNNLDIETGIRIEDSIRYDVTTSTNDASIFRSNDYDISVRTPSRLTEFLEEYSRKTEDKYFHELYLLKESDDTSKYETIKKIKEKMAKHIMQAMLCKIVLDISDDELEDLLVEFLNKWKNEIKENEVK